MEAKNKKYVILVTRSSGKNLSNYDDGFIALQSNTIVSAFMIHSMYPIYSWIHSIAQLSSHKKILNLEI
jgi:hypothetical protein